MKEKIYITGIDLSSAFDTIVREKLIVILETILHKDKLQMVKFPLKDTKLQIKMSDIEPNNFNTNIGSPQGDGLSGVSLNIYFENSLRKLREELDKYLPNYLLLLTTKIHQMKYNMLMMQILLQKMNKETAF